VLDEEMTPLTTLPNRQDALLELGVSFKAESK
jgi:hypothetical protein